MSSRLSPGLRPLLGFFAIVCVISLGGFTRGQDELPGNNEEAIRKEFSGQRKQLFGKLLRGDEPFDANKKEHRDALDSGAKYIAYSLTWITNQNDRGKIDAVLHELEDQVKLVKANKSPTQQDIANAYSKAMSMRASEVLKQTKPIVRLNAARVLANVAELGQPEMADTLVDTFNQELAPDSKRNDGVVYYLLRGMRELLAVPQPAPPAKPLLPPQAETKIATALLAFIAKAPNFSTDMPQEEDGFCALRREAVHALAHSHARELKDKGITLLHVMARDGVTPSPHLDEGVEAALGVSRLRAEVDGKDYQPEYAAYQLAVFVDYFTRYYLANIPNPADKTKKVEQRPYRIYASRMLESLEAMKAETKNDYVAKAIDQCRLVLTAVEKGADNIKTLDLEEWLRANQPPKKELFQGVANSTVKPSKGTIEP